MTKLRVFSAIFVLFSAIIVVFLINLGLNFSKQNDKSDRLRLSSYKNTVALYEGETLIKTYDDVVLNVLPEGDKQRFAAGIYVESEAEAQKILEDYDG